MTRIYQTLQNGRLQIDFKIQFKSTIKRITNRKQLRSRNMGQQILRGWQLASVFGQRDTAPWGLQLVSYIDNKNKKKSYWNWMDENCQRVSYQKYENLTWQRKMSFQNLQKAFIQNGRVNQNFSYVCGMHALNMCWLMLGYDKNNQWTQDVYPHDSVFGIKVGYSSQQFAYRFIVKYFQSYSWACQDTMPWNVINTNYANNAVIVLVGTSTSWIGKLHYIVIIAESDDGHQFIVTDSTEILYCIKDTTLSNLMKIYTPRVNDYNAYRVG